MQKEHLKSLIIEQFNDLKDRDSGYPREVLPLVKPKLDLKHTLVITGPRRCGKSTLLLQIMREFLEDEAWYYFRFDDERLLNFSVEDFNCLYEGFIELFGERKIFIFDEIQNINGWERFVNRMYESGHKFILTGSNANLLSRELSSHLTGRHMDFELYPFSFREFLLTEKASFTAEDLLDTRKRARCGTLFREYLETGGYPEYLRYRDTQILQELFKDILSKDIILRYEMKDTRTLREMASYLISNVTSLSSYNKLRKRFDIGSSHTVKNYLEYFEEVYLFFELPMFSWSVHKQQVNLRKVYAVDNGLIKANSFAFSENLGIGFENLVFTELRRRGGELYYHRGKHECDFLVKRGSDITEAIQVTLRLGEKTRDREINGIVDALEEYDLKLGLILTMDQKETVSREGKTIRVLPACEWVLHRQEN